MPTLEPTTQSFIDSLAAAGGPALYELSPQAARDVLRGAAGHAPAPAATVEDAIWPVGPTGSVEVRIVRPEGVVGTLPVILYTHGGGWILGDKDTHIRLVKDLATGVNACVVFPNYTPAPDAKYPVQNEQAYAALEYVATHAEELNVDLGRLALAGDSVGGNMAAVLALMIKERGGPTPVCQVLMYPVTDYVSNDGSYEEYSEGPWLSKKAMQWFFDAYLTSPDQADEITVSPLRATDEQLSGLPEALVITDENDVLRDEGEAYARRLYGAGVRTTAARFEGTCHDFLIIDGLAKTPAVEGALALVTSFLKRKLA